MSTVSYNSYMRESEFGSGGKLIIGYNMTQNGLHRLSDNYITELDITNNNKIFDISDMRYLKNVILDPKEISHKCIMEYCKGNNISIRHKNTSYDIYISPKILTTNNTVFDYDTPSTPIFIPEN